MKSLSGCIAIVCIGLASCKPNSLIPGFTIGMSEQDIKSTIKLKLSNGEFVLSSDGDTTYFIHKWKLSDDAFNTSITFNHDGAPYGDLRLIVISLKDSIVSRIITQPIEIVNTQILPDEEILTMPNGAGATQIIYSTCPAEKFNRVLAYLQANYGQQDSLSYKINEKQEGCYTDHTERWIRSYNDSISATPDYDPGRRSIRAFTDSSRLVKDTIYTQYHFHDRRSIIVLKRDRILPPSKILPYFHISSATLYQVSSSYKADLANVIEKKEKGSAA